MSGQSIQEGLRQAASSNGLYLKGERKIIDLLAANGAADAEIINVFGSRDEKGYLVVTSKAVHRVTAGLIGAGKIQTLPLKKITEVKQEGHVFQQMIFRRLVVEGRGTSIEFQFGAILPDPMTEMADRERLRIAEHNLNIAATEIEDAMARLSGPAEDPAIEAFHRGMAEVESGPALDTEDASSFTAEDFHDVVESMRDQLRRGDDAAAWARRCSFGYRAGADHLAREDQFWLQATGALAALRSGIRDHPLVASSAGMAEQLMDRSAPDELEAQREIESRYFGRQPGD